jgi:glycosyltransferase involved in cell wall biosynthesis
MTGTLPRAVLYGPRMSFRAFVFYRDSPQRRAALAAPPGSPERYGLFGLDQLAARGVSLGHNLEAGRPPVWARTAGRGAQAIVHRAGGYGGDFAGVLASLRRANRADVVLSTVDTVGIPLLALKAARLLRPPLVYVSIGLLPRLVELRERRLVQSYARVLRDAAAVVAYGAGEAAELEEWLGGGRVVFVPFGVDTALFAPTEREPEVDVLSVGADPRRDFGLLVAAAERNPSVSFRLVASLEHVRALGPLPPNLVVEADLPFDAMRERLAAARVVALPVRDNMYSGATTVLLQALASAKPVVVSRTAAIADGYGLADGESCRLVPPGDAEAFGRAILDLLSDRAAADEMGRRGRELAERELSWDRYVETLRGLLASAALPHSRS